jgi:hypothetical protein
VGTNENNDGRLSSTTLDLQNNFNNKFPATSSSREVDVKTQSDITNENNENKLIATSRAHSEPIMTTMDGSTVTNLSEQEGKSSTESHMSCPVFRGTIKQNDGMLRSATLDLGSNENGEVPESIKNITKIRVQKDKLVETDCGKKNN